MKKLGILLLALTLMLLPFAVSAGETTVSPDRFSPSGASIATIGSTGNISNISGDTVILTANNLSDKVAEVLGTSGGEITFSFACTPTYQEGETGALNTYISILNGADVSGSSVTKRINENQLANVSVRITISISNSEHIESIKISNISLSGTPDATPTPSASPSEEPTPDGTGESPSPTPDGELPSVDPSEDTSTIVPETPTPTPTKTPGIIYEPTKDPYKDNTVTNAPPTLDPNIKVEEDDIATPVPEDTSQPFLDPPKKDTSSSPEMGLIIMFAVLFLLLGIDIIIIIWRKQMGYGNEINGGISRRKMRDDLYDYPEDEEDAEIFEDNFTSSLESSAQSDNADEEAEQEISEDASDENK
ncbi:MAG: hypothetical protein IKB86_02830 [Clostridia bacterium]|nr:hypothetical protein [Clostridia bacterium]